MERGFCGESLQDWVEKPPKTISLRTAAQFRWNRETKKKKNSAGIGIAQKNQSRKRKKKKKKQRVAEFVDPRAGGIRVPRGFLIARARGSGTRGGSSRRFPRQGEGELGIGDFGAGGFSMRLAREWVGN